MALTAETLLPLLKYPTKSSKELAQVDMKVDGNVNAGAHFLAAVHSANWGQRIDVVRHHVRTALEYDRGIARHDAALFRLPHPACAFESVPQFRPALRVAESRCDHRVLQ